MGPRFASLRHPNVVMAPALTDARQTQKLQITPTTIPPEASDSAFKLSNGKQFSKVIQCKRILSQTQNTLCNLPVKQRFVKTSDKINFCASQTNYNNNNNINSNSNVSSNGSFNKPKINLESQVSDNKVNELASDYLLVQSGCGFIMNNSDTSMGDLEGNMGLNKSESESLNYMKEKGSCSSEVDQLFRNFQNVDEILQVIKSMESGSGDGENEISPMDPGTSTESEGIFPIPDTSELQSGLANFDRELFTDVDVMNICGDENLGDSSLIVNKETFIKDKVEEVQKKQYYMERKLQRLVRRLHKMQARTIGKHTCEEVTGFLEHLNQMVHASDNGSASGVSIKHQHSSTVCDGNCDKDCKRKAVNNISVLFRRLEQASQQQALAAHRHTKTCRYFGSGSRDYSTLLSSANGLKNFPLASAIVPKFSESVKSEVEDITGQLHTQLKMVENGVDSDVTASSSGGESCDETPSSSSSQQYYQQQTQLQPQQNLSISKRAVWRWAHDRAEIASKWTWLQAQLSDLDYKIRQHTEYHRQIKTSKEGVVLQGEDHVVVNGYHGADSAATATSSSRTRPMVRSMFGKRKLLYVDGLHNTYKKAARPSTIRCGCRPPDPPCALCTGRPDPTHPRDHPDLMTVNERVALLDPAFHPVLSFPSDISQSVHFEALMRNPEWQQKAMRSSIKLLRVMESSLQDRSSSSDILSDSRRLGGNNVSSNRRLIMTSAPSTGDNGMTGAAISTSIHKKYNSSGVRKNTANSLSDKIKKLARGRKVKGLKDSNNHMLDRINARKRIRHSSNLDCIGSVGIDDMSGGNCPGHLSSGGLHVDGYGSYDHDHDSNSCRPSPVPSPTPPSSGSKEHTRRKRENSYDIDNIVIPYSVASATRLEKLQYKEILTPKWRVLPVEPLAVNKLGTKNNGVVRRPSSHESDIEDISEETVISRHERCEQEERKKFSTYLKLPSTFARTRHRRTDSRAESSGANTPDPMSPVTAEGIKESGSPITSPPATPLATVNEIDSSEASALNIQQANIMRHGPGRRRTISLSQAPTRLANQTTRCDKEDTRPNTPVDLPNEVVSPYEPRTFPLPDEIYEKMLNSMPPGHSCSSAPNSSFIPPSSEVEAPSNGGNNTNDNTAGTCVSTPVASVSDRIELRRPLTPLSDSTESAIEEDPNDPEWTVTNSLTVDRSVNNKR